jgi:cell division protein FtsI (penicillin-binding protein 3)
LHVARSVIIALLLILVARLVQLQGFESTKYAEQGQQKRLRDTTLIAQRGAILDRNGAELAMSQEARTITADPSIVENASATAAVLSPILHMRAEDIQAKLTAECRSVAKCRYAILAKGVDVSVARDIMALKLAGISYEISTKRIYPNAALASSLVGFVGADANTGAGIERQFNAELSGHDGRMVVEQAKAGVISSGVRKVTEPAAGRNVQLTIDRDIQWMAQNTLASEVQRTGSAGGHVIVLDVKTGEILAMASAPTFDANDLKNADPSALGGISAIANVYEPGSVNKVVTAAAAIETGTYGPDSTVVVPPSIRIADKTFDEHGANGHEQRLTLRGVIARSSNVGTITIAQRLGKQTIYDYLRKFGLGEKTGVGLKGESKGLLAPVDQWSGSQVGNIPIGQGVSVTALQMAQMYAIVANGGVKVTPSIIRATTAPDGTVTPAPAPTQTRIIKESTAAMLRDALEAVTSDRGTAPGARIDGYRIAGKTGTAKRVRDDGGIGYEGYISSFIGFAPAESPQLLVEVVLDRPAGTSGYYAGTVSTPAFKQVMSFALAARKVAPSDGAPPVPLLFADPK